MHPILFHLGRISVSTQGVLVALGLLAGLQLACLLAPRRHLDPDRLWNLGLSALLTLFLGERMLVIAFNLRDFIEHPLWMLGLTTVRDERYFYGAALLAICAACGYILAWRLPWRAVFDSLAPGAGLALACMSLGSFAAGADFGRPTVARWGVIYFSRTAARTAGTPLGIPLIPTTLYAALLQLLLAGLACRLVLRAREPGAAAAVWLVTVGFATILLDQLRYPTLEEPLLFSAFTLAQTTGILALLFGLCLWLSTPAAPPNLAPEAASSREQSTAL